MFSHSPNSPLAWEDSTLTIAPKECGAISGSHLRLLASGENHGAEGPSSNVLGQQDVDAELMFKASHTLMPTAEVLRDDLYIHVSIQTFLVYRQEL